MARRYDSRTTIFSPEGRLYQVEYAMEAISNAGAAIGILSKERVVLAAEKRITSKVLPGDTFFLLSPGVYLVAVWKLSMVEGRSKSYPIAPGSFVCLNGC